MVSSLVLQKGNPQVPVPGAVAGASSSPLDPDMSGAGGFITCCSVSWPLILMTGLPASFLGACLATDR